MNEQLVRHENSERPEKRRRANEIVHVTEVLERLVRDVKIVIKNFSLAPTDNLHSPPLLLPNFHSSRSERAARRPIPFAGIAGVPYVPCVSLLRTR